MANEIQPHPSIRGYFAHELSCAMEKDLAIRVISCDLGFGMFDSLKDRFPDRYLNVGSAEQAGMGVAVGMAMEGLKPFIYSITPFLIYRPFETMRNYINHEKIPVRLVASGVDDDYKHDGFSHHAFDVGHVLNGLHEIEELWPKTKEEVPDMVKQMVEIDRPWFIALRRSEVVSSNDQNLSVGVMKAIRTWK